MRRLYRWTGFVPKVTVVLQEAACMVLVKDKGVHARLKAHVLELGMYGVAYKLGEGLHVSLGDIRAAAEAALEGDAEGVPQVEHVDRELRMPQGKKRAAPGVDESSAMRVYFDGRSADKLGSGGFVAFSPTGECLGGAAYNYGAEAGTVNAAELESLKRALEWVRD